MRRFFTVFISLVTLLTIFLCSCSSDQIDRGKELKRAMDTCDSKWSQAFPEGTADFEQVADYIAGWGGNAGLEVTKKSDHYVILTNKATKGNKKSPSVTVAVSVDPSALRDYVPQLSLGMTSVLGPAHHGRIRLIVTEIAGKLYPGATSVSYDELKCSHFIDLAPSGTEKIYTDGPMSAIGHFDCRASRVKPSYANAFRISIHIPEQIDPYTYDKEDSLPNPINVLGDLLASAKSSGRLFEIASFTAKENGDFLPSEAKAVVVIDDNNVEAFQKRFETSFEAFQKRFGELNVAKDAEGNPVETFSYTMEPVSVPSKVLRQKASDNIISLMYTLQTGIHLQDETTGDITAASYIRSISTKGDRFRLDMDMRSRSKDDMEEMSGIYLITSGLCDVDYDSSKPARTWSCKKDSSLAAWFTASVNKEDVNTTCLQSSECDQFYRMNSSLDIISYHYDKSHRQTALDNLLAYFTSLTETN